MFYDNEVKKIKVLRENQMISSSERNLRSKIESILRSLENLSQKKLRIEFEIKRQKKSLIRKREELKRVSKSTSKKLSLTIESQNQNSEVLQEKLRELRVLDNKLLQESSRLLED